MHKTIQYSLVFVTMVILILTATVQDASAQILGLPEGAKARLGKGYKTGSSVFSEDGTRFAIVSSIGLWIYDVHTGKEVALLTSHPSTFTVMAFSPDGRMLASANENTISLWEIHTGREVVTHTEHSENITTLVFSPDSKVLASGSEDNTIRLWTATAGKLLFLPLTGHAGDVTSIAFSPDSKVLASGSTDNTIRLWSATSGQHLATLEEQIEWGVVTHKGHTGDVTAVAFSPDGTTLASGDRDNTILLWDIGTRQHRIALTGHRGRITALTFSRDGATLVSGSTDDTIRLWDTATGKHLDTLEGHESDVIALTFSSDGATLASGDAGSIVRLWVGNTGQHLDTRLLSNEVLGNPVRAVTFAPDGVTLASGEGSSYWRSHYTSSEFLYWWTQSNLYSGLTRLWNAHTRERHATIYGHKAFVYTVAFSPDGSTLASGGESKSLKPHYWANVTTYSVVHTHSLQLWDTHTRKHLANLKGHSENVSCAVFSPDGKILASGSWDDTIRLWNPATGQHLTTFHGHRDDVNVVAFSPDGATLVSGSNDDTIKLWNPTGEVRATLYGHEANVTSVVFSPDGKMLASGSADNTIRLWNPTTGEPMNLLEGHTEGVSSVAFSMDGVTLASGSWDNTIRLWDSTTGEHLATFSGHRGNVNAVAFSPDGRTLASGSSDGTILLWELTPSANADAVVSITPSPVQSPAIGQQLTINVDIADGETVAGYQLTVQFDETALRYVDSSNGDYLPGTPFVKPSVVEGNQITLVATSLAGESNGDGTLASLTFEVIEAKASTLTLSGVLLSNNAGKRFQPRVESAQITEPPQLTGDVNQDGTVNIQDLVLVASSFGKSGQNKADVNEDGVVNIQDLVLVAGAFGNTAAAPSLQPQALAMLTAADVQGWLTQARSLGLTDAISQRGIIFLEHLLAALIPKKTALLPNYPNPFNPETWIPYHLSHPTDVMLTIYNTKGAVVRQLDIGHQPAGFYTARSKAAYWNGRNASGESVASGVYFYQLRAGDYSALRRMVIVK